MTEFYKKIVREIKNLIIDNDNILTAWEGGSAATGFLDESSDLDLAVIVKDEYVEDMFALIDAFLIKYYSIDHKFRVPEPAWHSNSQAFYISDEFPEFFYLDFFVEKESSKQRFTESDRHGDAVVWFDKQSLLDNSPTSPDEINQKCRSAYQRFITYFPFMLKDVKKQVLRGNKIDAMAIFQALLQRYVLLLNIKYRPAKYDFGLRYLYRDFPQAEVDEIEKMMMISNLEELTLAIKKVEKNYQILEIELSKKFREN